MRDDLRFAARRLLTQPGLSIIAVLTLALGLGANTAIFTLLNAVMFQPLPVARPQELVRLGDDFNCCVNSGLQRQYSLFSTELYEHLRQSLPEFSDLVASQANATVAGIRAADAAAPISTPTEFVSANYFRMFGITPAAGRLLEPGDDAAGAPVVMVMSHRLWTTQFASDPGVVGKTFYIGGVAATLAGIAPPEFFGETMRANPTGVWLPLGQEPVVRGATSLANRPQSDWLYLMGRLAPGAARDTVAAKAGGALRQWLSAQPFWSDAERKEIPDSTVVVVPAAGGIQRLRNNFGQSLTLLIAMSGLVLLIAAANLANLLLARADRVTASIRAALGASRARLIRQSLIEGLLLSLVGCAGALVVASAAARAIVGLAFPADAVLPLQLTPSPLIVAFAVALALITGALFAAAPAWAMGKADPIQALRGLAREGADLAFMPRRSLVIVQVTLSLTLLAGAGLLVKSLSRAENQPLGFDPANRLIVQVQAPPALAGEPDRLAAMYTSMQSALNAIPGVIRSSYSLYSPMEGNNWSGSIGIAGRPVDPAEPIGSSWNRVGPDFFETTGTRIVRGRGILATDTPASEHVAVVNETFVATFFPNANPIGQQLGIGSSTRTTDYTIVGVSADVKYSGPTQPVKPMIHVPTMQTIGFDDPDMRQTQARSTLPGTLELQLAPGAGNIERQVRTVLASANQNLLALRFIPLADQVAGNFRTNRLLATLAASYGLLALALASLGLYGVTAYGVSRRTHEIGVRMALGADRGLIVRHVLQGALLQAAAGLIVGVPLALYAAKALTTQLYGVEVRDPLVFGGASAVLLMTAALAAALPARRAASVDPTNALRQ